MVRDKTSTTAKPADPENGRQRRPCRICGSWVPAGAGHVDPGLALHRDVQEWYSAETGAVTLRPNLAADVGRESWVRWHRGCDNLDGAAIIQRITGDESLTYAEAFAIARRVEDVPLRAVEADREPTQRPWGYLLRDERAAIEAAHAAVVRLRAADGMTRCSAGACGCCGAARSRSWHIEPAMSAVLRWADRSPAPACETCWPAVRASDSRDELEARAEQLMLGTGRGVPLGWQSSGLRLYAEVDRTARHRGHGEPWAYSKALDVVRARVWEERPELAPERVRLERELVAIAERAEAVAERRREELVW